MHRRPLRTRPSKGRGREWATGTGGAASRRAHDPKPRGRMNLARGRWQSSAARARGTAAVWRGGGGGCLRKHTQNRGVSTSRPAQENKYAMHACRKRFRNARKCAIILQSSRVPPKRRDSFAPKIACASDCSRAAASDALCGSRAATRAPATRHACARDCGAPRSRVPA